MVSSELKRESLHEKLQLLRSITHSHAINKTSIIVDASKYIVELKQKVERLNQYVEEFSESSAVQSPLPAVAVETLEKGFLVNVFSGRRCPGLLALILEAFEELGLNVLEARVSCTDNFRLQAIGVNDEQGEVIGSQVIKQTVVEATKKWSENNHN
ncbi:hypothetical protein SAY87_018269 [Trapa incisa]|uniref:Plant bHLH transcription factor ACT-like domain-containing protein n=1 Tax=Trapa incisa TaxID=236973 RepID=A0AAN7QTM4_9MYRT|nr:hypothetical protein SAY87_018269 [Trapa incisa]